MDKLPTEEYVDYLLVRAEALNRDYFFQRINDIIIEHRP